MIELKRIYPECCADTLLVELILKRGKPAHYKGISKVSKALEDFDNDSQYIVGLINTDKFKRQPTFIEQFEIIENRLKEDKILITKYPNTNKYAIRIHPEFEPWIWEIAERCGINPGEYGYDTLDKLYEASKKEEVTANPNFKKFVNAVVMKTPPQIQILNDWLRKVFDN